ncbi:MAG: LD-carboxypeptidase [Candidatus Sumerlaeia bacterium]
MPQKPRRLQEGDLVAVVAPASAPPQADLIDKAIERLKELGFRVKPARHVRARWGFLAGGDAGRARDINAAFADPRIRGVFCVRGGYGSGRLLRLIDFQTVRANPKVFVGYSDITALHCAFLKAAGMTSFHGPMLTSDLIKPETPPYTLDHLHRAITTAEAPRSLCADYPDRGQTVEIIRRGRATGPLVGGNLSLLCTMIGTPWQPPFKGRILFLEDVDEKPYGLDRNLTHLLNAGVLEKVAGVALGQFADCVDPKAADAKEYRQTTADVLRERLHGLGVPVVAGLPFGHVPFNATLPVGARATLDAYKGDLILEEAGVK